MARSWNSQFLKSFLEFICARTGVEAHTCEYRSLQSPVFESCQARPPSQNHDSDTCAHSWSEMDLYQRRRRTFRLAVHATREGVCVRKGSTETAILDSYRSGHGR